MDAYGISASGERASWIVRFARQTHRVLTEINQANKRATMLRLSYGLHETDSAPDTYAEFLLRSRAVILREPAARCRGAGHQVR